MKLHKILLAAAFIFSACSVFAQLDPANQNTLNDPQFIKNPSSDSWSVSGYNSVNVVLLYKTGTANTLDGYAYYLVAHQAGQGENAWDMLTGLALSESAANGEQLFGDAAAPYQALFSDIGGHSTPNVYKFSVSFDDTAYDQVGILGRNGSPKQKVNSVENKPATNGSSFNYLATEKVLTFKNGNDIKAAILVNAPVDGGSGNGGNQGAPLPAPVTTLLIALGFGAALVMYRNRKQAKA
jgi:hypothetical protein